MTWTSRVSTGLRRSKLRLEERRRSVERRIPLIRHRRKALEHVRDAWGDLECDGHLVDRCPACKPKSVAEQDLLPKLGYAASTGLPCFGTDVYNGRW